MSSKMFKKKIEFIYLKSGLIQNLITESGYSIREEGTSHTLSGLGELL